MKGEAISSSQDPLLPPRSSSPPASATPTASSAGASSPAIPICAGSTEWLAQGQNSKGGSLSQIGSQPMYASLSTNVDGSALGSSQPSCRPWERGDLLRRLSTFKPANWFGKPKAASSLACARKGWVNVDVDKVECESCGAILKFVSSATWTPSEADGAGEEFSKSLDEGHKITCPWIENCCAESLVQFPPTPPSALVGGYKDRCDGLLQFPSLPVVSASVIEQIRISKGPEIDRLLAQSQSAHSESGIKLEILLGTENSRDVFLTYSCAQKVISLCGWEPRWLPNVQDCEEYSAQSARNGCSIAPSRYRGPPRDPSRGKKALSSSTKKGYGMNEVIGTNSKSVSRSPLLDCSLCGATVRILDFLTVSRPSSYVPNGTDIPETSKKMVLTRGISAASGVSGWVAVGGTEKEQAEDHDEAATDEGKSLSNIGVELNITVSAGVSSSRLHMNHMSEQYQDVNRGKYLLIGQPSSSEVGDRAASYESRGPSSRKRNLEEGGSTVDRPQLLGQQADSVEGTVIDRDGDEVDDGGQYSAGPSKRARDTSVMDLRQSPYRRDSSGAGPSRSFGFNIGIDAYNDEFVQGPEKVFGNPDTRDLTRVSSVIAMDTVYQGADNDSMESVENYPGDFDDVHLPSTSGVKNIDANETSGLNFSNHAQQSTCPAVVRSAGEIVVSSTNEEVVVNADTATEHGRDGPSLGISGGSVGMGASHEAEIHGTEASIYRADSVVGDIEPIGEIADNQGQTGEFGQDPGLMGDFVPEEMDREDPHGDSQDLMARSIVRADSGSKIMGSTKAESGESGEKTSNIRATYHCGLKIVGSTKAESGESGEKTSNIRATYHCGSKIMGSTKAESGESGEKTSNIRPTYRENSPHPSLSCNAILCSGLEVSKEEVTQAAKEADECCYAESGYQVANGSGPPNGGSNYDEAVEFDPIKHHNQFCPWVNGNVAAAGCSSSSGSGSVIGALAVCGWQLTLDALDAFQSQGQVPIQTVESESAASLYKDDHHTPSRKLLARHSFNKSRRKN